MAVKMHRAHFVTSRSLLSLACLTLIWLAPAEAETIRGLNQEYQRLSQAEGAVLDQIDAIENMLAREDALLVGPSDGPIYAVQRRELRESLGKASDYAQILGVDDIYFSTLSGWQRLAAQTLMSREVLVETAMAKLEKSDPLLRAKQRENLGALNAMLGQIRADAAKVLARRNALRTFIDTGKQPPAEGRQVSDLGSGLGAGLGSGLGVGLSNPAGTSSEPVAGSGPETNPVCLDESVPVDHLASFHKIGYGSSYGYAVKGDYICREALAFQYIAGNRVMWYQCNSEDPHDCSPRDGSYLTYTNTTDDSGNRVLSTSDGGSIVLHPPN